LADLVLVLKLISGANDDFCAPCLSGTDPDGDGRLGPADAINILQRVAQIR
jgi:hypothetical protein